MDSSLLFLIVYLPYTAVTFSFVYANKGWRWYEGVALAVVLAAIGLASPLVGWLPPTNFILELAFAALTPPLLILFLPERKTCPVCKTRASLNAKFCPHCQHEYAPITPPPALPPIHWSLRPAVNTLRNIGLLAGAMLVAWAIFGLGLGIAQALTPSSPPQGILLSNGVVALPSPTPVAYVETIIALQNIPLGTLIQADMIDRLIFLEASTPLQALSNLEEVIGQYAVTDIYREQIILRDMVSPVDPLNQASSLTPGQLPLNLVLVREFNEHHWRDAWIYGGLAGDTITFMLEGDEEFKANVLVWHLDSEQWVEGTASLVPNRRAWVVSLPLDGAYEVMVTREHLNNGATNFMNYSFCATLAPISLPIASLSEACST